MSHVSRRWRAVALGASLFWIHIHRAAYQHRLERIAIYLERSTAAAISIKVCIGEISSWPMEPEVCGGVFELDDDLGSFCQLVEPHRQRCRSLFVESESSSGSLGILHLFSKMPAPFLRTFKIWDSDPLIDGYVLANFTRNIPTLVCMHITGPTLSNMRPLGTVTMLRLSVQTECHEIGSILSSMPSLTHLEFNNAIIPEPLPPGIYMTLRRVINMVYDAEESYLDRISQLLRAIYAPSLKVLSVKLDF